MAIIEQMIQRRVLIDHCSNDLDFFNKMYAIIKRKSVNKSINVNSTDKDE